MTTTPKQTFLTTEQFNNALIHHIDQSKPDPLVKNQMMNLRLKWEDDEVVADDTSKESDCRKMIGRDGDNIASMSGTLTLSSEYIAIAIHATCNWRVKIDNRNRDTSIEYTPTTQSIEDSNETPEAPKRFQDEFYFRLGVTASLVPIGDYNKSTEVACTDNQSEGEAKKVDRKEKALNKKLWAGMIKRLRADPLVQKLLVEDASSPILVCEALIQQNGAMSVKSELMSILNPLRRYAMQY
jgi:hypothetical protein